MAPAWLRKIGCVTTSRADAGIYRPLLRALAAEPHWRQIVCFAGGTHHARQFGRTVDEFEDLPDVRLIAVEHLVEGNGATEVAVTAGRATTEFSRAFSQSDVDLVFVLGDRTEMLAAALAATIHTLPIAHLHGGDVSTGAYDEQCRHAITKLAHVHFPALPQHAERIRAMGEEPWRIHAVGALALDTLRDFTLAPPETLRIHPETGGARASRPHIHRRDGGATRMSGRIPNGSIELDFAQPTIVVVYHPETLSALSPKQQIEEVIAALRPLEANMLVIGPNADVGHGAIGEALSGFAASRPGTALVSSLPQRRFWSCLAHARLLVGNSSAGILEAASFGLPVVNIGDRQAGRLRPANVIDAPTERKHITAAIKKGMSPEFTAGLANLANPYGDGHAAERIMTALRGLPDRRTLLTKRWPASAQP